MSDPIMTEKTRLLVIEAVSLAIKRFVATDWRWKAAEEAADAAIAALQGSVVLPIQPEEGRARPSDQALAVPAEPASRLDPAGFDPSRRLTRAECDELDALAFQQRSGIPHNHARLRELSERYAGLHPDNVGLLASLRAFVAEHARGVGQEMGDAVILIALAADAIATEAQRAETVKHGSVHEGAGRRHRTKGNPA